MSQFVVSVSKPSGIEAAIESSPAPWRPAAIDPAGDIVDATATSIVGR